MTHQHINPGFFGKYQNILKGSVAVFVAAVFLTGGFSVKSAHADVPAVLGVTQITAIQTFATADNTFADGWKWVFNVTVPSNETVLQMKFADWTNGSNIIPAGGNIQFYSAQSTNAADEAHAVGIAASSTYSGIMNLDPNTDLDVNQGGRQIQITVEARVPTGSAGGSYSTSYGINAAATSTISLNGLLQTYDATLKTVTASTTPPGIAVSVTYDGSTTPPIHVGSYAVVATITDPNYLGSATGTLVVAPADVTVVANPQTKLYDGATTTDPALTYAAPSLFGNDTFIGTLSRDPGESVGSYNISQGTLALDGDYLLTFDPSTFVITSAAAQVSLNDLSQTYGSTTPVTASTTPPGLTTEITYNGSLTQPTGAGTYAVKATITDPDYTGSTTGSLVIAPAPLTVTATTSTKVYDGTTSSPAIPVITSGTLFAPDSATWTQTFDTKDVGTAKTLTPSGTFSGNSSNDYNVTFVPDTTGVITPATTTVSATGHNKAYDGTTAATTDLSVTGAVNGDSLTATDTANFATSSIGTDIPITVTGITLSGTDAGDYAFNDTATTSADITVAPLTVTADNATSTYGSGTTFAGTEFTSTGLISGDSIASVDLTSPGAASTSPVSGSPYAIVPSNAIGTGLGNYDITYSTGQLVINPAPVTVAADPKTKAFSASDPAFTYQITSGSLFGADAFTGSLARVAGESVGSYPITQGTLALDGNYDLMFASSTLTITSATSTITLNNLNQTYGSTTPVTASTTPPGLTTAITYNGSLTQPTGAGTYTVVATITDPDYTGSTTGSLVIARLPLTVTAVTDSKPYDGTASSTGTPTVTSGSLINGDSAIWTQTFDTPFVGTGKTLTPSGKFNGNSSNDYATTFVPNTTGVITAIPVTVTASGTDKVYDGTTDAVVSLTVSGAKNGDILTATGTANFSDPDASTSTLKTITVTGITLGGSHAADYAPNPTATTSAYIEPKPLTLVVNATTNMVYNGTNEWGYIYTLGGPGYIQNYPLDLKVEGVIGGDKVEMFNNVSIVYGLFSDKNVGNGKLLTFKHIDLSGLDIPNITDYTYSSTATTTGDITPATLAASIVASSKPYDGTTAASTTCSLSGKIGSDSVTCAATAAAFNTKNTGTGKAVTATGISLSGTDAGNYTVNSTAATTAAITKLAITVTAAPNTKPYDGTTTAVSTPTIAPGLVGGDTASFAETYNTPDVGTGKTLTPSGTVSDSNSGNNYNVSFASSTAGIITSVDQTVTIGSIPSGQISGNTFTLTATDNSGLTPITFSGGTTGVCTVDSGGLVTLQGIGTCTVTATEAGNADYNLGKDTVSFVVNYTVSTVSQTVSVDSTSTDSSTTPATPSVQSAPSAPAYTIESAQ